ncbi:hypothetical protein BDV23DRAFT_184572 [Aspergillus alliaceus]|uniref:Uncharacterized protein n=1 Tax=Petromyces alliaceus TaxID=209559 RepID=A0A5N7C5J1_PETAA|nr:hypothetical protein BDV23DRAFT_184572 [Aspergillus alliaceus]
MARIPIMGPYCDDPTSRRAPLVDIERGIYIRAGRKAHAEFIILGKKGVNLHSSDTARKPYDVVVTCILLPASTLASNSFYVCSNGLWNDEWMPARSLYERLRSDEVPRCPWFEIAETRLEEQPTPVDTITSLL